MTLLEDRFGAVPTALATRIKALKSLPRLKELAAKSWQFNRSTISRYLDLGPERRV